MGAPQPKKPEMPAGRPAAEIMPTASTSWDTQLQQLQLQFLTRAQERLDVIESNFRTLQANPAELGPLQEIKRHFHWIGGSCSTYNFEEITDWGIYGEEFCEYLLKLEAPVSSLDLDKIASTINTVIRLFTVRYRAFRMQNPV